MSTKLNELEQDVKQTPESNSVKMRFTVRPDRLKKNQAGYTMIELGIALLVIGTLAAVVFGIWHRVTGQSNSQKMAQDLTTLVNGIHQTFQNDPNGYQDVDAATLINAKIIPGDLMVRNSTVVDQFGSTMTFAPFSGSGGGSNGFFTIKYAAVPSETCTKLLSSLGPDSYPMIDVGSKSPLFSDGSVDGNKTDFPGAKDIAAACGDGKGTTSMTFYSN